MPTFQYKAKTQSGETVTGTLVAGDQRLALAQLGKQGYYPLLLAAAGAEPERAGGAPRQGRTRVSATDILMFTQQLATLLRSGMPLRDALSTLVRRSQRPALVAMLARVRDDIVQGATLSDALAKFPRSFSRLYVNLIRAGEASGGLGEVLARLTKHYEQTAELRERVVSALIYPLLVVGVGIGTIIFFMTFMVPRFAKMFEEMHRTMPLPTRLLIGVSHLFLGYWWVAALVVAAAVVVIRQMARTPSGRLTLDGLLLRLPVFGPILTLGAFAQFARTLATLLENGVPVLTALQIVENTMTNQVIALEIKEARSRVTDGTSLSEPLAKGKVFPPLLIDMLAVGEASGEVVPALKNIADNYERELAHRLKVFTTLLEPAIIIVMAVMVGAIMLSVLLAVFDMTSGISR